MKRKVRHATRTPTRLRIAPMSPNAIAISASEDTIFLIELKTNRTITLLALNGRISVANSLSQCRDDIDVMDRMDANRRKLYWDTIGSMKSLGGSHKPFLCNTADNPTDGTNTTLRRAL